MPPAGVDHNAQENQIYPANAGLISENESIIEVNAPADAAYRTVAADVTDATIAIISNCICHPISIKLFDCCSGFHCSSHMIFITRIIVVDLEDIGTYCMIVRLISGFSHYSHLLEIWCYNIFYILRYMLLLCKIFLDILIGFSSLILEESEFWCPSIIRAIRSI